VPAAQRPARRRVLVVMPSLQPPGGGNAVAAWIIHAIKDRYDVSTLTWQPVELDHVNQYYGTDISKSEISSSHVPPVLRCVVDRLPTPALLLKASLLFRFAKRVKDDYDVVVCGHNETDFGARCVQYIHYPSRLRPRPDVDIRWFHVSAVLRIYYALCEAIANFAPEHVSSAVTIANSTWTGNLVDGLYGLSGNVRIVHPPVQGARGGRPWQEREDGFVCVGRLMPEKELERVMRIIAAVREQVPTAHLHLIGSRGSDWYWRRLRREAERHGEWVQLHGELTRSAVFDSMASHKYAIHGMREEHFGMAPAEAVASGCITFVPNGGGQVDIVGNEDRLLYASDDDAVRKIVRVMTDEQQQTELVAYLEPRRQLFATERFLSAIRAAVDEVAGWSEQ